MRVLCVGLLVCDIVIKPVTKQTLEQDTSTADVIDITIGGDACNVARGLKQLGLDVSLMSIVGDDYWGKFILEQLSSSGLETKFIKCHTPPTSISAVLVSVSGNRSFVSLKGSCHQLQPDDISDEILKEHEILYVGSAGDLPGFEYEPLRKLLARAKVLGLKTIMDLTGEITSSFLDCIKNSFEYLDAFVPSIREVKIHASNLVIKVQKFLKMVDQLSSNLSLRYVLILQGPEMRLLQVILREWQVGSAIENVV